MGEKYRNGKWYAYDDEDFNDDPTISEPLEPEHDPETSERLGDAWERAIDRRMES